MIGKFDNFVALRSDAGGDPDFREFLVAFAKARAARWLTTRLCSKKFSTNCRSSAMRVTRPFSRSSLIYDERPLEPVEAEGLRFVSTEIHNHTCKLDLRLRLEKTPKDFPDGSNTAPPCLTRIELRA